jgi:alkylation response protein AidB-like acyl-CoA dehydrogenase
MAVITLAVAALLVGAGVKCVRLIRDWAAERRRVASIADQEAARARLRDVLTDYVTFLVSEAKKGRWHVSADALLDKVPTEESSRVEAAVAEPLNVEIVPGTGEPPAALDTGLVRSRVTSSGLELPGNPPLTARHGGVDLVFGGLPADRVDDRLHA